jgi:hypothetical protein
LPAFFFDGMSNRVDAYRRRAEDCERAASRVSDPNIRAGYFDMAVQWRPMAEQQQAIDDLLAPGELGTRPLGESSRASRSSVFTIEQLAALVVDKIPT